MRADHGENEAHPAGAMLLRERSVALRELANTKDKPEARAEVEAALASKWWGLRVLGIRARGRWGSKADKAWLVERARRPLPAYTAHRSGPSELRWQSLETSEARIAVARLIDETDWAWVLDLGVTDPGHCGPDIQLFARIPDAPIEACIQHELAQDDPARIKLLLRTVNALRLLSCRKAVLERCARHRDPEITRQARMYLKWGARA